jgi:sec-independent protein translocase protein TatB
MFDVGFFELLLIGIIALLVVGPERLPKVTRTAGAWVGRATRFVTSVKQDIEREVQAEELKKAFEKGTATANPMHEIIEDTKKVFDDIKQETESVTDDLMDKKKSSTSEEK